MVRCSGGGQVSGFLLSPFCRGGARLKAEAVVAGFNDGAMVLQAIEQRRSSFFASPNTPAHSLKLRFVVMTTLACS